MESEKNKVILVVDDEEAVRGLLRLVLRRGGYEVLDAPGGLQALDLCRRPGSHVDLLLTDIMMPAMDGTELADRFSALFPRAPVLYISGKCDAQVVEDRMRERGHDFLPKPFDTRTLLRKIDRALGGSEMRRHA